MSRPRETVLGPADMIVLPDGMAIRLRADARRRSMTPNRLVTELLETHLRASEAAAKGQTPRWDGLRYVAP